MSAQIINALRGRAEVLDAKAAEKARAANAAAPVLELIYREFAAEFRALADEAEGREPS